MFMSACHSRMIPSSILDNEDIVIKIGDKVPDFMTSTEVIWEAKNAKCNVR